MPSLPDAQAGGSGGTVVPHKGVEEEVGEESIVG
jgi:hypothetical protein